ncbi:MAG: amino acid ABC transporter permease [Nitrospira sp.]|nr:amino acid ABC transporter permease [Nitrospira sp.]
MATSDSSLVKSQPKSSVSFLYDERVRNFFYQTLTAGTFAWLVWYLFTNTAHNLEVRGMNSGFGFLFQTAGFDTDFKLIEYTVGTGTYGRIFFVGVLNTLFVSVFAIVASTVIGFFMGVMRLSTNWLISRLALTYVEILRNVPLLIQIIFWYLGVFALLPKVKQSADFLGIAFLNNRGLYVPSAVPGDLFWMTMTAFVIAVVAAFMIRRWARRRQEQTGQQFPSFWAGLGVIVALPGVVYLATGMPLSWDIAALEGFNYQGGFALPPAFLALLVSLTIYHSAHMAEAVRAGILSVSKGQTEAANALGLRPGRVMRLVIIPQAMLAIVPPMISTWMNVVKNSSLAVAIGYSDVVALFMQTSLNQSGYAIEIVAITMLFYMTISLTISFFMNIYNKRVQLRER